MSQKNQKIILIGYMGTGKSTIGRKLAKTMDRIFVDLDEKIVAEEGQTIDKIFKQKGEDYFRALEKKHLKKLLSQEDSMVISLGGGTPMIDGVMPMIQDLSISIYLNTSVEILYNRLKPNEIERPLLSGLSTDLLKNYITEHLSLREPFYLLSDLTIVTNDATPKQVVNKILEMTDDYSKKAS